MKYSQYLAGKSSLLKKLDVLKNIGYFLHRYQPQFYKLYNPKGFAFAITKCSKDELLLFRTNEHILQYISYHGFSATIEIVL